MATAVERRHAPVVRRLRREQRRVGEARGVGLVQLAADERGKRRVSRDGDDVRPCAGHGRPLQDKRRRVDDLVTIHWRDKRRRGAPRVLERAPGRPGGDITRPGDRAHTPPVSAIGDGLLECGSRVSGPELIACSEYGCGEVRVRGDLEVVAVDALGRLPRERGQCVNGRSCGRVCGRRYWKRLRSHNACAPGCRKDKGHDGRRDAAATNPARAHRSRLHAGRFRQRIQAPCPSIEGLRSEEERGSLPVAPPTQAPRRADARPPARPELGVPAQGT
jgi:hypothetical protein